MSKKKPVEHPEPNKGNTEYERFVGSMKDMLSIKSDDAREIVKEAKKVEQERQQPNKSK